MSLAQDVSLLSGIERKPAIHQSNTATYREVYTENCHRIYALAICLTDDEPSAEELMTNSFCRAFARSEAPSAEAIDRALVAEVRRFVPLGEVTLDCVPGNARREACRKVMRLDVERAVVQLPYTERLIFLMHDVEHYDHARIARTLGVAEDECRRGLHQARLRMRELLVN